MIALLINGVSSSALLITGVLSVVSSVGQVHTVELRILSFTAYYTACTL